MMISPKAFLVKTDDKVSVVVADDCMSAINARIKSLSGTLIFESISVEPIDCDNVTLDGSITSGTYLKREFINTQHDHFGQIVTVSIDEQ